MQSSFWSRPKVRHSTIVLFLMANWVLRALEFIFSTSGWAIGGWVLILFLVGILGFAFHWFLISWVVRGYQKDAGGVQVDLLP